MKLSVKIQRIKWTPNFAYAVGLLTADGNLSPDGRHLVFVSKDIDLIDSFKDCLNLRNRVSLKKSGYFMHPESKRKQFRIRITSASAHFLNWLRKRLIIRLGTKGSIERVPRAYQLNYYKDDSRKIVRFMYYSNKVPCLKRKYDKAKLMNVREWRNWNTCTA